jgi:hypothetical protein
MEANTTSSKVMVAPDDQGNVIRVSKNNPEYGHVRLTQNRVTFNTQGWVNKKVASTLIHGTSTTKKTMTQSELTNILEKSDKKAKKEEKVEDSKEEPVEVEDESFEL